MSVIQWPKNLKSSNLKGEKSLNRYFPNNIYLKDST